MSLILPTIEGVIKKYNWEKLNDEQKAHLATKYTTELILDLIEQTKNNSKEEFEETLVPLFDFSSFSIDVYFQYSFIQVLYHLTCLDHWFPVAVICIYPKFSFWYLEYANITYDVFSEYRKFDTSEYKDVRQINIILRNSRRWNGSSYMISSEIKKRFKKNKNG